MSEDTDPGTPEAPRTDKYVEAFCVSCDKAQRIILPDHTALEAEFFSLMMEQFPCGICGEKVVYTRHVVDDCEHEPGERSEMLAEVHGRAVYTCAICQKAYRETC